MEIISLIIIVLWQIILLCDAEASGEACCTTPDIFTFDVNCTAKELRWTSSRHASFGFCYHYKCSADDNVDYCSGLQEECFYKHDNIIQTGDTYLGQLDLPNTIEGCCFWIENVAVYRSESHGAGCSELICCNNESPETSTTFVMILPSETTSSSDITVWSKTETLIPSPSSEDPSLSSLPPLTIVNTTSPMTKTPTVSMTLIPSPSSEDPSLSSFSPSITVTSAMTETPTASSMTLTPNHSSEGPQTNTSTIVDATSTTSLSAAVLDDSSSARLYIILVCVVFIFMVLLLTTCICLFLIYWKISKKKNNELEMSLKTQIEKYCKDTGDLPKDCVSEIEVVVDDKESSDTTSIAEQDVTHMLKIIFYGQSLLQSLISINSEGEDVGIADVSATSHYCYGGSAGQTGQSSTSSQRASCSSATPLSSNT